MKSYVKEFIYPTKEGGESTRKLFVMRENATAMDGLELTYLSDEEAKLVQERLKDHEVKDNFSNGEPIDGYESDWGRAWRRYNKDRIIVKDEDTEKSE